MVTAIRFPERPAVQIIYRVRSRNGELKIVNVIQSGLDLIVMRRAEFSAYVRTHGVEGLLSALRAQGGLPGQG